MNKQTITKIAGVILPTVLLFGMSATAFAQTPTQNAPTATKAAVKAAKISKTTQALITKADTDISKRLASLSTLSERINAMTNISADMKASLANTINTSVSDLNNLKTQIDAETDVTKLRADVKSVTTSTRIYALVEPQARILAAADKASQIADTMTTLGVKFDTRISTDQAAGKDVSSILAAQTDFNAKLADVKTQVASIISAVSTLAPDGGNAATAKSNKTALTSARTLLETINKDLKTARAEVKSLAEGLTKVDTSGTTKATN